MKHITYNCIEISAFNEGMAEIITSEGVGFINTNGEFVIPTIFEHVEHTKKIHTHYMFKEGLSAFVKEEKCGYIDILGNNVISLTSKYDIINPFRCGTAVVMEGKWMLPTPKKNANETDSDYLNRYREEIKKCTQKNRFGAINRKGELTVELKYQYLSDFSETLAAASIDGKKTYINTSGETVLELPRYDLIGIFSEGLAWVKYDKKYGCIDKSGNLIIPTEYDNMPIFTNQYSPISKNSKWGIIDKDGTIRLPIQYDSVSRVENEYAVVRKGASWSIVSVK